MFNCLCIQILNCICIYVYVYAYVHVHVYVYVYVYIYMYMVPPPTYLPFLCFLAQVLTSASRSSFMAFRALACIRTYVKSGSPTQSPTQSQSCSPTQSQSCSPTQSQSCSPTQSQNRAVVPYTIPKHWNLSCFSHPRGSKP